VVAAGHPAVFHGLPRVHQAPLGQIVQQRAGVGGGHEHVYPGEAFGERAGIAHAHQAAHQADDGVGALFLERPERA